MIVCYEKLTTFFFFFFKRTVLAISLKKNVQATVKLFKFGNQTKILIRSRAIKQCQDMNQKEAKASNGK